MREARFGPQENDEMSKRLLVKGMGASPGTATGVVVFRSEEAVDLAARGTDVILVRVDVTADDVPGMKAARGIVTTRGGITGDAAVVARSLGKPCIASCPTLHVDYAEERMIAWTASPSASAEADDLAIAKGSIITIDGARGEIWFG